MKQCYWSFAGMLHPIKYTRCCTFWCCFFDHFSVFFGTLKSFISNFVRSMTFVYFFTPITSAYFCFTTELYHCGRLTYHRAMLRFVLSTPSSGYQPTEGVSPFYDISPHRGYPLTMTSVHIGGIPLSWQHPTKGVAPFNDVSAQLGGKGLSPWHDIHPYRGYYPPMPSTPSLPTWPTYW